MNGDFCINVNVSGTYTRDYASRLGQAAATVGREILILF